MAKKFKKFNKKAKIQEEDEIERVVRKYGQAPRKERSPEEKREYLKLFIFLVGWVVILSAIYMTCLKLEFEYIMHIYLVMGTVLFFIWLIYNGGVKKPDLTKIEKPDDMGYDEFCSFIEKLKQRQKKSKYFLILFIPFPLIMLMDYIIIVWGDKLSR